MHRILCLLILLVGISCQKWKPSVEQVAELCGPELQGASIVRFQEPDGDRLYTDETYDFSVFFQASAGNWRELNVNVHGCVVPPKEPGTLVARSLSRSWAWARAYEGPDRPRYEEVKVSEAQTSEWQLACPTGGWIVDDQVSDAIRFTGSKSEVFETQIKVRSESSPPQLLSQKGIGFGLTDSILNLNLRPLEAGIYELQLFVGFAGPETLARPLASCPLEIVRHEPVFAQDPWRDGEVLRVHEKRPFGSKVAGDRLMVCRSPGFTREPGETCEAAPACQDLKNFVEATSLTLDTPGRWTYIYYLENRAGRAGPRQCRRVYGSERAPDFAMRWQETRWNEVGTVLSSLPAQMEASFETQGHSLEPWRPAAQLSCKVDFVRDALVSPGAGVLCQSGLCAGQSLEEFVPCSSPLRFSAAEAFQTELLLNSELRLTIRADDGAGQVTMHTKTLQLKHAQNFIWTTSSIFTNLSRRDKIDGFWYKADGGLLVRIDTKDGVRFHELARFSGGTKAENWRETTALLPAEQSYMTSEVSITEKGTVFISSVSRNKTTQDIRNEFARLDNGAWTPIIPKGWDPVQKKCSFFLAEDDETFLCLNTYTSIKPKLLRLSLSKDPEVFPALPFPNACKTGTTNPGYNLFRNDRKELFAICSKELAFRLATDGSWESLRLPSGFNAGTDTMIFDEQDQPWFIMRKDKEAVIFAPTRLTEGILPPRDIERPDRETIAFDPKGRLRIGAYYWNDEDRSWTRDEPLIAQLGTSAIQVRPVTGEQGALLFATADMTLFRSTDAADRLFPHKSLQWTQPTYEIAKLGPHGELCFSENLQSTAHVRCILRKNWAQMSSIPDLKNMIASAEGELFLLRQDGFYRQDQFTWTKFLPPVPEFTYRVLSEGDSLWATIGGRIYRLKHSEKVWRLVSEIAAPQSSGFIRTPARWAFSDSLGQNWVILSGKTRTLFKFSGDTRSLIDLPDSWEVMEIIPWGDEIILLNEVSESGQKLFRIHGINIRTHEIQEHDPAEWGFDFSGFAGRNISDIKSWAHEQAVIIFDKVDRAFEPMILDFRLKKQVPVRSTPYDNSLAVVRLKDMSYLVITPERAPFSNVENYSFKRILPDGRQQFLYDADDLRAMEDKPGLDVILLAPSLYLDRGARMWIVPSERGVPYGSLGLLQFDLEALANGRHWRSR